MPSRYRRSVLQSRRCSSRRGGALPEAGRRSEAQARRDSRRWGANPLISDARRQRRGNRLEGGGGDRNADHPPDLGTDGRECKSPLSAGELSPPRPARLSHFRRIAPSVDNSNGLDSRPSVCYADGMATPGQLVQAVADVLGIPAVTVSQYDRQLAEAGLRTKAGRGTSAAKMTPTDVANLLMAILGSPVFGTSIRTAAQTCEEIGSIYINKLTTNVEGFADIGLITLAAIPKRHTFREALVALIEAAGRGERLNQGRQKSHSDWGYLEVKVYRPHSWASIRFVGKVGGHDRRHGLAYSVKHPEDDWERDRRVALEQERSIDYSTIEAIVSILQMQWV